MPHDPPRLTPPAPDDPLAAALAALRPAGPGVDLPVLMYRAGEAAQKRAAARWRRAFAAAAVGLAGTWSWIGAIVAWKLSAGPGPGGPASVVDAGAGDVPPSTHNLELIGRAVAGGPGSGPAAVPPPAAPTPAPRANEYLRIRDAVVANGLDGSPTELPRTPSPAAAEYERSLQLLGGVLTAPYRWPTPPPTPDPDPMP